MKCLLLHACQAVFFVVVSKELVELCNQKKDDPDLAPAIEISPRYLTNWNFILQALTFFAYLLNDVLRLTKTCLDFQVKMKKTLDFFFYSIIGPEGIFVPIVFWALYLSNEQYVNAFPKARIELIMTPILNHSVHTLVAVNVILHAYFNKVSSFKLKELLPPIAAFNLLYTVCLYVTYYEKAIWAYGFLRMLNEPFKLISLLLLTIWAVILGFIFNLVNNWHCNVFVGTRISVHK